MNTSIGVIGYGVIGKVLADTLDCKIFDPDKGYYDDMKLDAVFVSVPSEAVSSAVEMSGDLVFVRSTVLPGTCDRLSQEFRKRVYAMPEFLTQRRAKEDFKNLPIIVGCLGDYPACYILEGLFDQVRVMSNMEAELGKFAHNCFGALKVTYFNMIFSECERLGIPYEKVREICLHTGFINEEHTKVPGPDGSRGYGGKCFPENMEQFEGFLADGALISIVREMNEKFRDLSLS